MKNLIFASVLMGPTLALSISLPVVTDPIENALLQKLAADMSAYESNRDSLFTVPTGIPAPCDLTPNAMTTAFMVKFPGTLPTPEELAAKKKQESANKLNSIKLSEVVYENIRPTFVTASCANGILSGPFLGYVSFEKGVAGISISKSENVYRISGEMKDGKYIGETHQSTQMRSPNLKDDVVSFSYINSDIPHSSATLLRMKIVNITYSVSFVKNLGNNRWISTSYMDGKPSSQMRMKGSVRHGRQIGALGRECYEDGEKIMDTKCDLD